MGSYQGQATLVLRDGTRLEGQAQVRTSKRLWEGTLTLATTHPFDQADEVTRIELPTGETRPITVIDSGSDTPNAVIVTFTSTSQ